MKTFNFSLQRVLDLRVHERKKAEQSLARIRGQCRKLEERIAALRRGFEESTRRSASATTDPASLRRLAAHCAGLREKQHHLRQKLSEIQEREREARQQLIERRRAEETLQSLYEDERDAHVEEQSKLNQQLLDEQAIAQHIRQNPHRYS